MAILFLEHLELDKTVVVAASIVEVHIVVAVLELIFFVILSTVLLHFLLGSSFATLIVFSFSFQNKIKKKANYIDHYFAFPSNMDLNSQPCAF